MKHAVVAILALTSSALAAPPVAALTTPAPPPPPSPPSAPRTIYRFDVTVDGFDPAAHPQASTYAVILQENQRGGLSIDSNIPSGTTVVTRQKVGLDLRLEYALRGGVVLLSGDIEVSSADPPGASGAPTIHKLGVDAVVPITPGTPALFTSAYDPVAKRHYEVHVAAQRLL